MKKNILWIFGILLIVSVSALTVDFYYSETCPYCRDIYPFVQQVENTFGIEVNYLNVKEIQGYSDPVPKFIIRTEDNRQIEFTGANKLKLFCEAQQMTTRECPTYQADFCTKESWFKV